LLCAAADSCEPGAVAVLASASLALARALQVFLAAARGSHTPLRVDGDLTVMVTGACSALSTEHSTSEQFTL
ncbi:hypothetical protein T492DRAFT_879569, partial [Pavlovales sp. CCMP2436]